MLHFFERCYVLKCSFLQDVLQLVRLKINYQPYLKNTGSYYPTTHWFCHKAFDRELAEVEHL